VKKLVVVIPARKGSKRLKNKNTLILGNKNLVERSIIFAKKLVKNNCIILSTDSDKILKIGKNLGILASWKRPKYLSSDKSKTIDVVLHATNWYEKNIDSINSILLLQPTTPFRNLIFFKKTIRKFWTYEKKNFISVNNIKKKNNINKNLLFQGEVLGKNNDNNFKINGSLYLFRLDQFKKKRNFVNNFSLGIPITSEKYQIDIDYLQDLKRAKKYENKN
tara:strand:- start:246 stop:905 length:660 start_codon:yes stop_codon:yes gene_type:complete